MRVAVIFFTSKNRNKLINTTKGLVHGIESQGHQVDLIDGDIFGPAHDPPDIFMRCRLIKHDRRRLDCRNRKATIAQRPAVVSRSGAYVGHGAPRRQIEELDNGVNEPRVRPSVFRVDLSYFIVNGVRHIFITSSSILHSPELPVHDEVCNISPFRHQVYLEA